MLNACKLIILDAVVFFWIIKLVVSLCLAVACVVTVYDRSHHECRSRSSASSDSDDLDCTPADWLTIQAGLKDGPSAERLSYCCIPSVDIVQIVHVIDSTESIVTQCCGPWMTYTVSSGTLNPTQLNSTQCCASLSASRIRCDRLSSELRAEQIDSDVSCAHFTNESFVKQLYRRPSSASKD